MTVRESEGERVEGERGRERERVKGEGGKERVEREKVEGGGSSPS